MCVVWIPWGLACRVLGERAGAEREGRCARGCALALQRQESSKVGSGARLELPSDAVPGLRRGGKASWRPRSGEGMVSGGERG